MAKFRYYVTDILNGSVGGTDKRSVARELAECDDYFVVDSETGKWLGAASGSMEVANIEEEP